MVFVHERPPGLNKLVYSPPCCWALVHERCVWFARGKPVMGRPRGNPIPRKSSKIVKRGLKMPVSHFVGLGRRDWVWGALYEANGIILVPAILLVV